MTASGDELRPFPPETCSILESMGDAFYAIDDQWRIVYANRRALEFWGLGRERVVGRIIWESLPQLVGTLNETVLRRVKAEQRPLAFELPSPTTGRWVNVTVAPWADGVMVYWRDVTTRRRAEQALRASEEHLRLAQEAGGIGTWEWDLITGAMTWSAQMFRTLGLEPGSGGDLMRMLLDAVHPADRHWAEKSFLEVSRRLGRVRIEPRILWPSNETRWIVFLGQVEGDAEGRPARMLGITIDGTSRRLAEDAIRADAERLRLAMRAGGLASWEFDLLNQVRIWSPEAATMIGLRSDAMRMSRAEWARMIHPDDLERVRQDFNAAVEGSGDYASEYRVLGPDAGTRWTAVRGTVLRDAEGRPARLMGVVQDVTERKQSAAQLQRLNDELEARVLQEISAREAAQARAVHAERMQALGQLAGGVAHDFNNVLQAVAGGANLIARRPGEVESVRRFSAIISEAANRGSSITRRLLAFAHRGELRAEPLDLPALLGGLREILVHTLSSEVTIEIDCVLDAPAVLADRGQLESVLVNLATNARDAMPEGGTLVFSARREIVSSGEHHRAGLNPGVYVAVEARDTGCGITPADLVRVSEPFFTTKPKGEGTGLGLAMARGFAEQSGGGFAIESEVGVGTTVTLYLPQAEEFVGTGGEPTSAVAKHAAVARIFLVDDDELVRRTLSAQLQEAGFAVGDFPAGADAMAAITAGEPVDCLVTDLSMPDMDGLALIQQAQKQRPRLPAILLTGYAGDGTALALSGAVSGSYSLLRKPVEAAQLFDRINLLLAQFRADCVSPKQISDEADRFA